MEARPTAGSPYRYSETQRVVRTALPNDKKTFRCEHLAGDKWVAGKGPDPWPAFNQADAIGAHGWILETEGEKCAELAAAVGVVAISQPGHAHGVDQIRPRYEALLNGGALGVVYLADSDDEGRKRAKQSTEAAVLAGLPIIVLHAGDLWPDLPVGGSIDDAPGTAAEQIEVIEAAARVAHARMVEGPLAGEPLGEVPAKQPKARRLRPDEIRDRITQETGPLRLNSRTGYVEADGAPLTGNGISHLYLKLSTPTETWGREVTADAATYHAMQDQFDPVAEWLATNTVEPLPMDQWERIEEHSLGLTDDPLSGQIIRRWLIGAIARAMDPGCWWRVAPVLVGAQNSGKTEWVRALAGDDWFLSGLGKLDRDAMQRLRRGWLVELGELDGITRKADQESLKAFLTERVDTYRAPYARTDEAHPRRCVFIGTANASPLRDSTGSSRFAVINTGGRRLPVEWVKQNRAAIWARALEQYRSGIPWTHPQVEMEAIALRNEGHTVLDPWHEALAERMELAAKTGRPIQNADLYNLLEVEVAKQTSQTAERIARIMQSLGWEQGRRRCDGERKKGWWPAEPADAHEPAPQAPPAPPAAVEPTPAPITQSVATVAPPAPVKSLPWHAEADKLRRDNPDMVAAVMVNHIKSATLTGREVKRYLDAMKVT